MKMMFIGIAASLVLGTVAWGNEVQQVRQRRQAAREINVLDQQVLNRFAIDRAPRGGARPAVLDGRPPFDGALTADAVQRAIGDAVAYIRSQQNEDGSIRQRHGAVGGVTSLAALAMLASGASPASDDGLRRALDWLAEVEVDNTYVRGIRANVWEYALRKVPHDERIRAALKKDNEWLIKALGKKTGWRYTMNARDWDNSCTQYGVLGIWAAARAGMEPGDWFWKRMSKHFQECQNSDGGWGYMKSGSNPNMATAGLASMFLVFDMYHGRSYYSRKNRRSFSTGAAADCLESLQRGMDWLGKRGGSYNDGYYLYGIERTGVASGRKYIGGTDWFAKGAEVALGVQGAQGQFNLSGHGNDVVRTCFATLFLVYGGAPVAFNKLEYGEAQDWNLNPRDLANVAKRLWAAYERPLNWQTVSITAPAAEFEAPILFISGSLAARFSDEEVAKLREYIDRGGTIFAEPTDNSEPFRRSIERLVGQLYPPASYPDHLLEELSQEHGVYTVMKQSWHRRPKLRGVSNGSRTVLILSDEYLSADWQMDDVESDAFKLAMNMLFYATDLAPLQGKFASSIPASAAAPRRDEDFVVARLRHGHTDGKASADWAAGRRSWQHFAPYARHVSGCGVETRTATALDDGALGDAHLVHLTGRRTLDLSAPEKQALAAYVERGGTVLVDAYGGSTAFASSARETLQEIFGELQALDPDSPLAAGRFAGGVDLSRKLRYKLPARKLLRRRGDATDAQHLQVAVVDGRPAVVFSEFDLTGALGDVADYRAAGLKPDSARKVVGNLVAYLMAD